MQPPRPSWHDEVSTYASRPGVDIVIDSDVLNAASAQGKRCVYEEDKNQLIIDGKDLSAKDEAFIIDLLQTNQAEGVDILDSEQEDIVTNYEGYSDTYNPYSDTLLLFEGKIPSKDLLALKMAYYMRIKNNNGEDISDARRAIRDRFGLRGLYIGNLCNSSYFEGAFRSTYSRLSTAKFNEYYELRVGNELAALFVHNGMTKNIIVQLIIEKIKDCSQNGIFSFHIHAMGGENVDLVQSAINADFSSELEVDIEFNVVQEALTHHPVFIDVQVKIL